MVVRNRLDYTGEYSGDYNELLYLRARMYAPSMGRFLTRDVWGGDGAQPISLNHFIYTYDNPINFIDPEGTAPIPPRMAEYLEQLRADTEKCYNEGDVDCVWSNYRQIAIGGYFFSQHASRHMMNFLTKGGDIEYRTALFGQSSAKWVMESSAVGQVIPKIKKELLRAIWVEAKLGRMKSGYPRPDTKLYTIDLDDSNTDVYYGLGKFSFWAEADYSITGCYEVEVKPIYRFQDSYDWNAGMFAGGTIPGVSGFEDDWAQMLVDHNRAKGFNISGSWQGPNKKYTFSSEWLNLPRELASDFASEKYLNVWDRLYDVFNVP